MGRAQRNPSGRWWVSLRSTHPRSYEPRATTSQGSQPPINIRRILPDRRLLLHHMVMRREVADRIGGAGIAGECEGLAAAAAEIDVAALAALARLRQETGAPEGVERGVVFPDLAQRMVFHGPEFEARDRLGRMARQNAAGRGHVE